MNLQDVYLALPSLYSEKSAKTYEAAFRRVETLTGRKLHQIPANDVAWFEIAKHIVWAGSFRAATPEAAARAFNTWSKKIGAAIRLATAEETQTPANPDARLAWDRLIAYAKEVQNRPDETGEKILPGMADMSLFNLRARVGHVLPAKLDTATATETLASIPANKADSYRRALRAFNNIIIERERHQPIAALLPVAPVGPLPGMRDAPLNWTSLSHSLVVACDAAIEKAVLGERAKRDRFSGKLGADPLPRRTKGKRKVGNPVNRRKAHRNALSWLIRHAWDDRTKACRIERLDDLLTAQNIQNAVNRYQARAAQSSILKATDETSSMNTWLANLETLSTRNGLGEEVLDTLADLRFSDEMHSDYAGEMAAARAAFVKLIDRDPAIVRTIITGPRLLEREVRRGLERWDALRKHGRTEVLHLCIAAGMMALQLSRPLRTRNLHELTCDGESAELLAPRRAGAPATVDIPGSKVKNGQDLWHEIPAMQWQILRLWLDEGRALWATEKGIAHEANPYLVPGLKKGQPVSRSTLNKAWNRGMSRLGLTDMTPHMMRHVGATIYIAENPGQYGVVADLLADKLDTVQSFYAKGAGKEAARLFAEVLARRDPTLNLF
ncbi:hypothetical protein [Acidimangrovimonas pyrenivorans]|uniref:Tyr recombinase domain-containing protein n=1 Tax=Acidimangrovimonas pyrenivorans TaxID=2030798 RepID=A0ABV7AFB7_9RHOB